MGISTFGGSTSDVWSTISSVTPTASSTAVSFTSISGYKKLMIQVNIPGTSAGNLQYLIRLNSDSGSNYSFFGTGPANSPVVIAYTAQVSGTSINWTSQSASAKALVQINETNTNGHKTLTGWYQTSTGSDNPAFPLQGFYATSSTISTVTLSLATGTFSATGTVTLYGVAA